jgi:hypothetical protein
VLGNSVLMQNVHQIRRHVANEQNELVVNEVVEKEELVVLKKVKLKYMKLLLIRNNSKKLNQNFTR